MKPIPLPFRVAAELTAIAHWVDREIVLELSGTADLRVTEQLSEVLAVVHQAGVGYVHRITVDITALEFMNSSCIKSFVGWLAEVQDAPGGPSYKVRFVSNPDIVWQRNSLRAIRCMVPEIVSVEVGSRV